jgi:uncharacterized protein (TIGR02217 family)
MDFIEKRLLDRVSFGSQSGLEFKTDIKQMRNGFESRLSEWAEPLRPLNVIFRLLDPTNRAALEDAFLVCRGRATGFRFRDPLNFRCENMPLGIGTGSEEVYQMKRTSRFMQSASYAIKKPVVGTIQILVNGIATPATIDYTSGLVTLTAPASSVITWSGEYDTPVRFDNDKLTWTYNNKSASCDNGMEIRATTDVGLQEIRT